MTRGSKWLIVAGVMVVVLVGLGIWRRSQLIEERNAARADRAQTQHTLRSVRNRIIDVTITAGAIETESAATRDEARELVAIAESLAGEASAVQKERDTAAVIALVAGGQVNQLRSCLDGINRALNQVSVGDPNSVATLGAVRNDCRAVTG